MSLAHGTPSSSNGAKRVTHSGTRSIGEVLAVLKNEFDDITISKIRFLESEGLVTPQRTASGYRKFTSADVERLRYILRQQKEHFLPLKVIRERLNLESPPETAPVSESVTPTNKSIIPAPSTERRVAVVGIPIGPLSRNELAEASGLTESRLRDLEQFGLLHGEKTATGLWYDGQALGIARLAARFLHFGVEPRHLRIFRTAADREADLYKQLVMPQKASRTAQAQTENRARMEELTSLGAAFHDELLRQALDRY